MKRPRGGCCGFETDGNDSGASTELLLTSVAHKQVPCRKASRPVTGIPKYLTQSFPVSEKIVCVCVCVCVFTHVCMRENGSGGETVSILNHPLGGKAPVTSENVMPLCVSSSAHGAFTKSHGDVGH